MAGGSTRLLDDLRRALEVAAGSSGWSVGRPVLADRLRVPVSRPAGARPALELVVEQRSPAAATGGYAEVGGFRLFYAAPRNAPLPPSDSVPVATLMDALVRWLRTSENALAALWTVRRKRGRGGGGAAPRGRSDPRTSRVLEPGYGLEREQILRVEFRCNQRCPFCFVRIRPHRPEWETIRRALDRATGDRPGANIVLSGGEPTLHPELLELVARIRARRPRRLVLQTNAVRLADAGFADRLHAAGVLIHFVSLHSHREETYDRITRTSGQFPKAIRGIRNLLAYADAAVTLNILVNRLNVRSLSGYVRFVGRLRGADGRPPGLFFTVMNDVGLARAPELAVPLETVAPALARAVALCAELGIRVDPFTGECAPPLCVLRDPAPYARKSEDGFRGALYVEPGAEFAPHRRVKRVECRTCRYDAVCVGVSGAYARRFGLEALKPFRGPRLSLHD
ncbi:MAG: radical SAM protein [Deltaproteobacteria bacterium]|nr:radical SAM protein [Deltaproteobacteria bacterium]